MYGLMVTFQGCMVLWSLFRESEAAQAAPACPASYSHAHVQSQRM